jgi:hypothetical protein
MSITFLSQLAVLLLNLGGTWLLQFILRRPLTMLDRRVKRSGWPHQVLAVTERLLHPLLAWGVHLGVINLFWAAKLCQFLTN